MTTFSALVDDIVQERQRPDMRAAIARYVNQTIRELHIRPGNGAPIRFEANMVEVEVLLTGSAPYTWDIPEAQRFMDVGAVYHKNYGVYMPRKIPSVSRNLQMEPLSNLYWYRSGHTLAFSGVVEGHTIQLAYYLYPRNLPYLLAADREVIHDVEADAYTTPLGATPTEAQIEKETNWILQRWPMVVAEGTTAKVFRILGDDTRSRTAYSAYEQIRLGMWNSEPCAME